MDTRHARCLLIIMALCALLANADDEVECPSFSLTYRMSSYNGLCYQFYYGTKTWKDAKNYCSNNNGRLAKVDDRATQNFLAGELNSMAWGAKEMWIGMHDLEEELSWAWTGKYGESDESVSWTNWHEEHPEGWFHEYRDCVVMMKDGGDWTWHEAPCNVFVYMYRFICEYEPLNDVENVHNVAGGVYQSSYPDSTSRPPTEPRDRQSTMNIQTGVWLGSDVMTGENRRLGGEHLRGDLASLNGNAPNIAETQQDEKDGHVPIYAVIVSFGAGVIFAVIIILVVVLRRRRKKHESESYPTVVYHTQPSAELGASGALSPGMSSGGAAGGLPVVCAGSGRSCKLAVEMGQEKCVCGERHENAIKENRKSNIYVSIAGENVTPTTEVAPQGSIAVDADSTTEANTSAFSSVRDLSLFNEEPPTYDEAIACAVPAPVEAERCENVYSSSPRLDGACAMETRQTQGAIPKTRSVGAIKQGPTETYLPMNGSPKLSSHSQHGSHDSNVSQYTPMSLGDLPPIPTDQGYEIPVSTKLDPETVKSLRSPMEEHTGPSSIYAEIPDRNSQIYRNEEQIYATID